MTCQELVDFLMAYLDGELAGDSHRIFEEHVNACPPCLDYLDGYRTTVALGEQVCADDTLPADVPDELVDAILRARDAPR